MSALSYESLRADPMTGGWVVVAPRRQGLFKRPWTGQKLPEIEGPCPFCPGEEQQTEVVVDSIEDAGAWKVRAVRNKYPVFHPEAAFEPDAPGEAQAPFGYHEVIVETPDHDADLPDYALPEATLALMMYARRLRALQEAEHIASVCVFRNRGRGAGSSQPHPHGQLLASSVPGSELVQRHAMARAHFERRGRSLLSEVLDRELDSGERLVDVTGEFVVVCPYASHRSYEMWIAPRGAPVPFDELGDLALASFADILTRTLRRLRAATRGIDYNLVWRLPPPRMRKQDASFWYLEILPRRGGPAGLELASGFDVVAVPPEEAAALLREQSGD